MGKEAVASVKLRQDQAAIEKALAEAEQDKTRVDAEHEEAKRVFADAASGARMGEVPGRATAAQARLRKSREDLEVIDLTLTGLQARLDDVKRQAERAEQEEAEAAIAKARAALDRENARVVGLLKEAEDVLFAAMEKWEEAERFHRLLGRELPNAMLILGEVRNRAAFDRLRRLWL